jgi:glycosyltransferase involved in cell wall biosynthesis
MGARGHEPSGKLRVVTLVDHLGGHRGGAERVALDIVHGLDPQRYERVLCVTRWSDDQPGRPRVAAALQELRDAGIGFVGLRRSARWKLWEWRPLTALLRDGRTDVLHAHKFGSNVWAGILGRLARVPVVIAHEHSFPPGAAPLRRILSRELVGRLADAVIAVSETDRRRMVETEGMDAQRVVHIPNGIGPLAPAGHDVRAELGIGPEAPVVGVVSGLRAHKAIDDLIRASARVARSLPALRVLVAGYGTPEEVARLTALVGTLGLDGTVLLLGSRGDIPDILAALDVAVSSSTWEGSSLSVLEYMDAGKPVVATRVGGTPELIADGVNGILVEPRHPEALAAALLELLADPERAARMGRENRRRRRREFDLETVLARVQDLYEQLYARSRRRQNPSRAAAS